MRHFTVVHEIEKKAKATFVHGWHRLTSIAHTHAVDVSREYCHILYFAGVFIEGHGFYTYAAGLLLLLSLVGVFFGGGEIDE